MSSSRPATQTFSYRETLSRWSEAGFALQDLLFDGLIDETAFFTNPDLNKALILFYFVHPYAHAATALVEAGFIRRGVDERIEHLFGSSSSDSSRNNCVQSPGIGWPSLDQLRQYRESLREVMREVIGRIDLDCRSTGDDCGVCRLASILDYEREMFETTSGVLRLLPISLLRRPGKWPYAPRDTATQKNTLFTVPAGVAHYRRLENPFGAETTAGDTLRAEVVQPFATTKFLVTNSEFSEFVRDRGYENSYLWPGDAWHWRSINATRHPKFWILRDGIIRYRTVFDEIPLPLSWPAEVNCYEAEAFCRWKGAEFRLMTEAEWIHLHETADLSSSNIGFRYGSPTPVDFGHASAFGLFDVNGNLWQWLSTSYEPLARERRTGKQSAARFDARQRIIAGGSWATTRIVPSGYRREHARKGENRHAGFRLTRNF